MTDYLPTAPYRGTRDFLPEEMSVRTQVFHRLYEVIEGYGFQRYDGPLLESAEIYEAKSGREIADQQLYSLTDRSGRRLALRPEMTPSAARMIAGNASQLRFPVRWYSHVNCHRYERPQRGRLREHWQINVDIFGSDSTACEIEIIELIHDMMSTLGASQDMWKLRVNDRVLLEGILSYIVGIPADKLREVSMLIDGWEKSPTEQLRVAASDIGLSERQFNRLAEALANGQAALAELPKQVRDRSQLFPLLTGESTDRLTFDPLIVRAFEYYTSTVFEVFDTNPANPRSLFGGGRYDNLTSLFSAQRIPGIGFGMGDVTMYDFLTVHGLLPAPRSEIDVAVIPISSELAEPARQVARQLRHIGLRASTPLEFRKLSKELVRAAQAGAHYAVLVGREEWSFGEVTVRDLNAQEQRRIPLAGLAQALGGTIG